MRIIIGCVEQISQFFMELTVDLLMKTDIDFLAQDENRYSSSRGAHLNLKRAEKARLLVNKIPGMIG